MEANQRVALKARVLLLRTFQGQVDRLAPVAGQREAVSGLTVYANLVVRDPALRPGMTGAARVYTGRRPIGAIAFDRAARLLRTEFWLWW